MIVQQTLVDVQRRHLGAKKRDAFRERSIDAPRGAQSTSISLVARLLAKNTSSSQAAVRIERAAQLRASIDQMDQLDREVLALRHFEELTNGEVAQVLGIQETAASNRYLRAMRRLKAILDSLADFGESVP